jgi:hypothetical protein
MKNEGPRSVEEKAEVPTPRCFFARVANKGVRGDAASMNVTPLEAEGLKARGDGKKSEEDNAETQKWSGDGGAVGKGELLRFTQNVALPEYRGGHQARAQRRECTRTSTRSFILARSFALGRLGSRWEALFNPRLPWRCLAGDGPGRLVAVEVII